MSPSEKPPEFRGLQNPSVADAIHNAGEAARLATELLEDMTKSILLEAETIDAGREVTEDIYVPDAAVRAGNDCMTAFSQVSIAWSNLACALSSVDASQTAKRLESKV